MKNLKAKLRKNGGFTLIEMLIVVAIIAILIAISIPLVGAALERARLSTDAANERAAKAEALILYMTEGEVATGEKLAAGKYYNYDAAAGKIVKTATITPAYGKNTTVTGTGDGKYISVGVTTNGDVYLSWDGGTTWYQNEGPVSAHVNGGTATAATVTLTSGLGT